MKMNEIIKEKRKALGLTQERIAECLGVSTPAVNKWEKGATYPDITLLPALARLLETDINALMAFHEDMSDVEIEKFVNELDCIVQEQGYDSAFESAMHKIAEYPTCEALIGLVAPYLDGARIIYCVPDADQYRPQIEKLYARIAGSEVPKLRDLGVSMQISCCMDQQAYEKAEELICALPEVSIDKQSYLAQLHTRQGKYEEASKLWERKLLNAITEVQTALMCTMDIALKEDRIEDAAFFAEKYEAVTKLFFIANWIAYTASFQLSVARKDEAGCVDILKKMLPAMKENWDIASTPLYRHLSGKDTTVFSEKLLHMVQSELQTSAEFEFIRENEEFAALLRQL